MVPEPYFSRYYPERCLQQCVSLVDLTAALLERVASKRRATNSRSGPSAHPAFASGYGGQAAEGYT